MHSPAWFFGPIFFLVVAALVVHAYIASQPDYAVGREAIAPVFRSSGQRATENALLGGLTNILHPLGLREAFYAEAINRFVHNAEQESRSKLAEAFADEGTPFSDVCGRFADFFGKYQTRVAYTERMIKLLSETQSL